MRKCLTVFMCIMMTTAIVLVMTGLTMNDAAPARSDPATVVTAAEVTETVRAATESPPALLTLATVEFQFDTNIATTPAAHDLAAASSTFLASATQTITSAAVLETSDDTAKFNLRRRHGDCLVEDPTRLKSDDTALATTPDRRRGVFSAGDDTQQTRHSFLA